MTPFLPGRRPDDPRSRAHARAIRLSAERLAEPLVPEEEAWLGGHLAACAECRQIADAYETESLLLRSMPAPEAPRDLWARTAAAIDADRARFRRRPSLIPVGALAGALVAVVVVGATMLSRPGVPPLTPTSSPLPSVAVVSPSPGSTPLAVVAGKVGWVLQQEDGTLALAFAPVQQVCSADIRPDCPPLTAPSPDVLKLDTTPSAILGAPDQSQLVVVDARTKTTGGAVYVVDVPGSSPTPTTSPSAAPTGSAVASPSPTPPDASPSAPASPGPSASPSVPPSVGPSPSPTTVPSPSPTSGVLAIVSDVIIVGEAASYSPDGRWFAFSARPADGSQGSDIYVWSPGDGLAHPVTSDHRSVFAGWSGDHIIGSRAVDLLTGGDPAPSPVAPGASPPASPDASASVGSPPASGPSASPTAPDASPTAPDASPSAADASPSAADGTPSPGPTIATGASFVLDPATGAVATIPGVGIWRPVVDPTGTYAAYWQGTLRLAPDGVDWLPDAGRLILARWTASGIEPTSVESPAPSPSDTTPASSGEPSVPAEPSVSAEPSVEPSDGATATPPTPAGTGSPSPTQAPSPTPPTLPVTLAEGPVHDWDIRWDETGTRLAVWLADLVDPTVGTLALHTLDRSPDILDVQGPLLDGQPSLPGFSIGSGRLAWATPPGQGGEGSRVEVLAWRGEAAGRIESQPGPGLGPVIVIR